MVELCVIGGAGLKVFLAREARDGRLLRLALYAVSVVLIAYVLWGMVSESWVHEDYVSASLVFVAVITATLVTFLHRNRPRDKFQFFHPWKIQETTTSKDLWLIAGFDTLVGLAVFGVFMAPMSLTYGTGAVFFAAMVGVMMLATLPNGYRYMRRQYDMVNDREGFADRRTLLRYKGYSDTHFHRMLLAGVPTSALVFVVPLFVVVLVF